MLLVQVSLYCSTVQTGMFEVREVLNEDQINKLTISGRGWAKYRDLSVASRATEVVYCFIIRLPNLFVFVFCFNGYLREAKRSTIFHARAISVVSFTHEQNIVCKETQLDDLRMSRLLFLCSYFQVTWWVLGQWKGKKFASNANVIFSFSGVVQLKTF